MVTFAPVPPRGRFMIGMFPTLSRRIPGPAGVQNPVISTAPDPAARLRRASQGWSPSGCGRRSSLPAQLGAGSGHGQLDEALTGWLMHLPEAEDREPVEQGGEPEGEVVDNGWGGEYALLDAAGDDGGEVVAPEG